MYVSGRGVPQGYKQAIEWFTKSAAQGYAEAQQQLGFMFANGNGVPQNYLHSYVWYNLAAAQGDVEAIKNRDFAAALLSPDQMIQAQDLSIQLQAQIDEAIAKRK
jgi:TPR repeat protein